MVTLDVRNAFNSTGWSDILQALRDRKVNPHIYNILVSYLRTIILKGKDEDQKMVATNCVPQGSVLGSFLWNLMYNNVLKLHQPTVALTGS